MTKLADIEGIGPVYAEKLSSVGIRSIEQLLEQGATPKGRDDVAEKVGATTKKILEWVNRADLFRIKGIGEEFSDLLESAGVDTVVELARRNPANLHAALVELNEKKKIVRQVPAETQVAGWIEQAIELPRVIKY